VKGFEDFGKEEPLPANSVAATCIIAKTLELLQLRMSQEAVPWGSYFRLILLQKRSKIGDGNSACSSGVSVPNIRVSVAIAVSVIVTIAVSVIVTTFVIKVVDLCGRRVDA
jgi:hypothetical protein